MGSSIKGSGHALPKHVVKNDAFLDHSFYTKTGEKIPKATKDIVEKLEEISGIRERRYIGKEEESIDLLKDAALKAIADAKLSPNELEGIIVAHNAGNARSNRGDCFHTVPNVAALLKNTLGVANKHCPAYDILFGCPGWVEGMIQAHRMIRLGEAKHVLVCGIEVASRFLDPFDVDSMLMGDGCGAVVLSKDDATEGIVAHATFSHAQEDLNNIVLDRSIKADHPGNQYFKMQGQQVYKYATTYLPEVIKKALDQADLSPNDIDYFFFHQANAKMLRVIAHNLMRLFDSADSEYAHKIPSNIATTGNTSVATVPTLFDMVKNKQMEGFELKAGQTYVFASVGAGMHCNAFVYKA